MMKAVFLGCGGRARGHAQAYQHVTKGKLAAICDMTEERLHPFGEEFGIDTRYTDMREMLEKEKPDLLHIVTPPTIRHSLMSIAAEYEVPAVIVEKPIAIQAEDSRDIRALLDSKTKFIVNTQLNFHPRNLELKKAVSEGRIGDIRFIDASARNSPVNQGPHVLQLVSSYIDNSRPTKVFGQVSGANSLSGREPSPDHATASIYYENGVRALVTFGHESAPPISEREHNHRHKRIAVYGTRGFIQWTMDWWELSTPEGYERGEHEYGDQDVFGQAGLTDAAFGWIEDDEKVHPTHLAQSLAEFDMLLGIYVSAMTHKPIELPFDPPDQIIEDLVKVLG
jgi:predicted dehydrogenase